jgi:hypothetical protein
MNKKIKGMMGFNYEDVIWEPMNVLAEVLTDAEDNNGFKASETFGVAVNQYGDKCLYSGSINPNMYDGFSTVILNKNGQPIPILLRELADKLDYEDILRKVG